MKDNEHAITCLRECALTYERNAKVHREKGHIPCAETCEAQARDCWTALSRLSDPTTRYRHDNLNCSCESNCGATDPDECESSELSLPGRAWFFVFGFVAALLCAFGYVRWLW